MPTAQVNSGVAQSPRRRGSSPRTLMSSWPHTIHCASKRLMPAPSQMPKDTPYVDATAKQQRVADASYEIAGPFQQELTKERLGARIPQRFGASRNRCVASIVRGGNAAAPSCRSRGS